MPGLTETWRGEVGGHVIALAWSPDGETLAAAAVDGPIALFGRSGELRHTLAGHGFGTCAVSWIADGARLASAGQDGIAKVWDAATGSLAFEVDGGSAWVEHVAWSPDGSYLATAAGKKLKLWDPQGQLLHAHPDQPGTIAAIGWKAGSGELASAAYGRLAIWSPTSAEPRRAFAWKGAMLALAWSPDGRSIATGDQDATVHLWDAGSGKDLMMWGYRTKVRELSWDSSGRYLATGGGGAATVWDCTPPGPEGTEPAVLGDPDGPMIASLGFRPAGPILATADLSGRLRVWRMDGMRGDRIAAANLGEEIAAVAWHPSGACLAASTAAGVVVVFDAPQM